MEENNKEMKELLKELDEIPENDSLSRTIEQMKTEPEVAKDSPEYTDNLIRLYRFFNDKIYTPKRVFYPCCGLDASPLRGFPDSEIILMDQDERCEKAMKKYNLPFIKGDVKEYNSDKSIDLIIIRDPAVKSENLVKNLIKGGYVISNNYHLNAKELSEMVDKFKVVGTIKENLNEKINLKKDISDMFKNREDCYVFQKK